MNYEVVNVSQKAIHSFLVSDQSVEPWDPQVSSNLLASLLNPGEYMFTGIDVSGKRRVTLTVDFVQFADGTIWYSGVGYRTVHPDGVRVGVRVAAEHLIKTLESAGPAAVLSVLPQIRAEVNGNLATHDVWGFGFYCGVTNVCVRVQHANREGGLIAIESALRQTLDEVNRNPQSEPSL